MSSLRIGINGAGGRMGRAVIAAARELGGFEIVGAAPGGERDLGGAASLRLLGIPDDVSEGFAGAEAVIDFSTPQGVLDALEVLPKGAALVTGTTGLSEDQQRAVEEAARRRVVVQAGNFSVGVNLLAGLVEIAAARLGDAWDIEISETHHRRKLDAPSGTALMLGRAAARGRGVELDDRMALDRAGARRPGDIGFAVSRAGGVVGEHQAGFTSERESVTLSHSAFDRGIFAEGALQAARWTKGRAPGLYDMRDVLGLKS